MATDKYEDMHAGEPETSILLAECPDLVGNGYQAGDHVADSSEALLTVGMAHYTQSGIIGRPSSATPAKGKAAIASLVRSFGSLPGVFDCKQ
jgi:creatinine amidohydrolase